MGATANVHISDDEHTVVKFEMGYQLHDFVASVRLALDLAPLKCACGVLSLYIVAAFRHPLEDTVGEGVSEFYHRLENLCLNP